MTTCYYVFTINNPTQHEFDNVDSNIRFAIWQLERAPSGTEHWQGYIEFFKQIRVNACCKSLGGRAHVEPRRGSQQQAIDYATKSSTRIGGPWRIGEPAVLQPGRRTDYLEVAQEVVGGASLASVASSAPGVFVRYSRGLERLAFYSYKPAWRSVKCFFLCGPPGTGKTSFVYDTFGYENVYVMAGGKLEWFDGYQGQDVLLIDEYSGGIESQALLRLLDGHPYQMPVKGDFVWARYTRVFITANEHWLQGASPALKRRFASGGYFSLERQRGGYPELAEFVRGVGEFPECLRLRERPLLVPLELGRVPSN